MSFELHHLSALEQWDMMHRGDLESIEIVDHYLDRAKRYRSLGAFLDLEPDAARERARRADESEDRSHILHGIPIADKALQQRAGRRATFGSSYLAANIAAESDGVTKALDAAGAVSIGSTNAPEFGMPAYTDGSLQGPALSPYHEDCYSGGSSGGAATAVAAGLLPVAPGSDGGGSIRIPAAACGLVGLKPSRGLVPSGTGITSPGGLPVPGAIARTVADAALLTEALLERDAAGRIPRPFALRSPDSTDSLLGSAVRGEGRFSLGLCLDSPWSTDVDIALAPEARDALDVAIAELERLGHSLDEVSLPEFPDYPAAFRAVWQGPAAGIPVPDADLDRLEPLTAWIIREGRRMSAATLAWALGRLTEFERQVIAAFSRWDAVLMPGMAMTPRPVGWFDVENGERNFEQQCQYTPYTSFVNVCGLPAIALPVYRTAENVPMGVQLVGRPGGEATLLAIGAQLERRIGWHRIHPPMW